MEKYNYQKNVIRELANEFEMDYSNVKAQYDRDPIVNYLVNELAEVQLHPHCQDCGDKMVIYPKNEDDEYVPYCVECDLWADE